MAIERITHRLIGIDEAMETDSLSVMFSYVVQGIIGHVEHNDGKFFEWIGIHAAQTYLDEREVPQEVIDALDLWLDGAHCAEKQND